MTPAPQIEICPCHKCGETDRCAPYQFSTSFPPVWLCATCYPTTAETQQHVARTKLGYANQLAIEAVKEYIDKTIHWRWCEPSMQELEDHLLKARVVSRLGRPYNARSLYAIFRDFRFDKSEYWKQAYEREREKRQEESARPSTPVELFAAPSPDLIPQQSFPTYEHQRVSTTELQAAAHRDRAEQIAKLLPPHMRATEDETAIPVPTLPSRPPLTSAPPSDGFTTVETPTNPRRRSRTPRTDAEEETL